MPHEPVDKHRSIDLREWVCRRVAWALTMSERSSVGLPDVHDQLNLPRRDSGLITFA